MSGEGSEIGNPYLHMTKSQLLRRHRLVEKNLRKIMSGRGQKMDFNLNRMTFLTISEALNDKYQVDTLESLFDLDVQVSESSVGGM